MQTNLFNKKRELELNISLSWLIMYIINKYIIMAGACLV